jgi:hypothetical protein
MTERMDLIVPAEAAQRVVRYKPGDFARCADEIGDAFIELDAPIFMRGEGQKRRLYWRDDEYVYWPLDNRWFPHVAAQIGLRCERWNERLGCYEAGWPPGGVVVAAVGRLLFRKWPAVTAADYLGK